jgi:hypothetical protein
VRSDTGVVGNQTVIRLIGLIGRRAGAEEIGVVVFIVAPPFEW